MRPDIGCTAAPCASQGRRDSNPQPPVLETGTLPIELRPYCAAAITLRPPSPGAAGMHRRRGPRPPVAESTACPTPGVEPSRQARFRAAHARPRWDAPCQPPAARDPASATRPQPSGRCQPGRTCRQRLRQRSGHHRVGHARRRRQGQGAQSRRPAGHRLRRRRARLPHPGLHRRGARSAPAPCRAATSTRPPAGLPELREAIAAKTLRDSAYRRRGQVIVTNGGKHAVYIAFATLLDPGDEVLLPTPYWTTYPEVIALAGGTPSRCRPTRPRATWPRSSISKRTAPSAPRCCCSSRRPTPPVRCTRPSSSPLSAAGPPTRPSG